MARNTTCDGPVDLKGKAQELNRREAAIVAREERIALRGEKVAEREWRLAERERVMIDYSLSNGTWASSNSLTLVASLNEGSSPEIASKANPDGGRSMLYPSQEHMHQIEDRQYIPRLQHTRSYATNSESPVPSQLHERSD